MGDVDFGEYAAEKGLLRCMKCGKRGKRLTGACEFGMEHRVTHAINIRRFQDGKHDEIHPSVLRTLQSHEEWILGLDKKDDDA